MAVVAAVLVLGAGVYKLPLVTIEVGVLPILLGLIAVAVPTTMGYRRVAAGMSGGGPGVGLGASVARTGAPGRLAALAGSAVYSLGATIGYGILGAGSLLAVAAVVPWTVLVAVGALLAVAGWWCQPRPLAGRLCLLGSWWAASSLLIAATPATARPFVALAAFAAGAVLSATASRRTSTGATSDTVEAASSEEGEQLAPEHRTMVAGLTLQVILMATLVVIAAVAMGFGSWPTLVDEVSVATLAEPIGVVLFALVGTGLATLSRYPSMSDRGVRRVVVDRSMMISIVVLAGWLWLITGIVEPEVLGAMAAADLNTAVGLSLGTSGACVAADFARQDPRSFRPHLRGCWPSSRRP